MLILAGGGKLPRDVGLGGLEAVAEFDGWGFLLEVAGLHVGVAIIFWRLKYMFTAVPELNLFLSKCSWSVLRCWFWALSRHCSHCRSR